MFARSAELLDHVLALLDGRPAYPTQRCEAAFVACGVAFEHAHGLRMLFEQGCPTTAMSVLRLQFEALVRGIWILYAAPDDAIEKLTAELTIESQKAASKLPMLADMVKAILVSAPAEVSSMVVQFKEISWAAMNSYVHAGTHSILRHRDGYPIPLVLQVMQNTNGLVSMTGMLAAIVTGDAEVIGPMRSVQTQFRDCLPALLPHAAV